MLRPDKLFAVTLDAAHFDLVKAIDETDAVDLAFGLLAAGWFSLEAANDNGSSSTRTPCSASPPTAERLT